MGACVCNFNLIGFGNIRLLSIGDILCITAALIPKGSIFGGIILSTAFMTVSTPIALVPIGIILEKKNN